MAPFDNESLNLLPPLMRVRPEQRLGQAAQNVLSGDLAGAYESILRPDNLTPQERDAFLRRMGLNKGPYADAFRALTNPALIISLALSFAFPVPSAKAMFKVAKRVGGMTGKFPFLGKLTSAFSLFRGTDVPDILTRIVRNKSEFHDWMLTGFRKHLDEFQAVAGRLPSMREQVLVGAWLDGLHKPLRRFQGKAGRIAIGKGAARAVLDPVGTLMPDLEAKMGAPLLKLAQGFRGTLDNAWGRMLGEVTNRKALARALARLRKQGFADPDMQSILEWASNPKKIMDYFPRQILRTEEESKYLLKLLTDKSMDKRIYAKALQKQMMTWVSPRLKRRQGAPIPYLNDLHVVWDAVDPKAYNRLSEVVKARILSHASKAGIGDAAIHQFKEMPLHKVLGEFQNHLQPAESQRFAFALADKMPKQYSLRAMPVLSRYSHSTSSTYAWTLKGGGEEMAEMVQQARVAGKFDARGLSRAEMLENTYIPIAMGRGTYKQAIKSQLWDQYMTRAIGWLDSSKVRGVLGDKLTDTLKTTMETQRHNLSYLNLNRSAASFFYLSTLGLNAGASIDNLFQFVLTTAPTVGPVTAARGGYSAVKKFQKYFSLRLGSKKLAHDAAMREAFKEFAEAGLASTPLTDEVIQNTMQNAYELAALPGGGLIKGADRIKRAMMSMFSSSETFVRVATFEAGMLHATKGGLKAKEAIEHARRIVDISQFTPGPAGTPYALLGLTPLPRQLAQFPARIAEFATSTALTLGSGERSIMGYNPGTLARMVAGSIIATEVGSMLGMDVGDALLGGAVPTFQEASTGKPFGIIPVVPPMFQILGTAASGLTSGDFTELMRSTPLLVPGGVAAAKGIGLLPPGIPGAELGRSVAKSIHRTYADYESPAPNGRIAVYTGEGRLKGFYKPWDLAKVGMGLKSGDMNAEAALMQMLVKNRDQIRDYRQQYLEALFRNDARKAASLARQYETRFGHKLPVTERDMETMQKRRSMTRLEQVLMTLPPEARPAYIQAVSATFGAETQNVLGIQPSAMMQAGAGSGSAREASRASLIGQPSYEDDMSPLDRVEPYAIGRERRIPLNPLSLP